MLPSSSRLAHRRTRGNASPADVPAMVRDAPFAPAPRVPLAQLVLSQIIDRIHSGALKPGDILPPETELMRMFGVGRSSLREALQGLRTLGLVDSRPGRGTMITSSAKNPLDHFAGPDTLDRLRKWALLDLLEVREALEGQAAALAAERGTRSDHELIRRAAAAVERDVAAGRSYFRANAKFHIAIARASRNRVLSEAVRNLVNQVRDYRERLMKEVDAMPRRDVAEHRAILDAICSGKSEDARKRMIEHIQGFAKLGIVPESTNLTPGRARRR